MDIINSDSNTYIKYLKKLYNTRQRKKEGMFILEGTRIIEEAAKSGIKFEYLYITPEYKTENLDIDLNNLEIKYVEKNLLEDIASTVTPQGIIAVVNKPDYNFSKLNNKNCILVLDRVQDPGNMGTLIRTAVAAGIDGIIALKGCVDIYNLKVIRATMGAIFNIPLLTRIDIEKFLDIYQNNKFTLIATDINGNNIYEKDKYPEPVFLVIGNEAEGIRNEILDVADQILKIPILGQIDSLNAGITGGIIMYDYVGKNVISSSNN
ncbi:MAG: TrmH family RNA methyltransferase [Bacillota bacterium]